MTEYGDVPPYFPTVEDLAWARAKYEENEPRDLFYRVATELVEFVRAKKTSVTLPEALAVLLQTWNREYYRFHPFDAEHFRALDEVVTTHEPTVADYRDRCITSLAESDVLAVRASFSAFEAIVRPVGAAKALHLLAPRFFPLWDRAIAEAYGFFSAHQAQTQPTMWPLCGRS